MRFLSLLCVVLAACAAEPQAPPAPSPPAAAPTTVEDEPVEAFLARFQEAVRRGDAEAVADLARFPIAGAEVPDRETFLSEFFPTHLGEGEWSFRDRVLRGTPDDLERLDDGRYQYVSLVESCEENSPGECYESAMIVYFAPEGETWVIDEIQFAG